MGLVLNTNSTATVASLNLDRNQTALQKSLARLSSGSKIVIPADDAGGLAVANKLKAVISRNLRAQQNVSNAISFLQVQDGALSQVAKVMDRLSELKTMSLDVTKNTDDIANYQAEFRQLQEQLGNIRDEKFNGINLFTTDNTTAATDALTVYTTELGDSSGAPTVSLTRLSIFSDLATGTLSGLRADDGTGTVKDLLNTGDSNISTFNTSIFVDYIQNVATTRAQNGAEMQRLQSSLSMLKTNHTNIEAAHSRLADVDMALESTRFTRNNIMTQSAASMLAQANSLPSIALQLLN